MMSVWVHTEPEELFLRIHELIRLYYRGEDLIKGEGGFPSVTVTRKETAEGAEFSGRVVDEQRTPVVLKDTVGPADGHELDRLSRVFALRLLKKALGADDPSYGILTGIRPTKLVHRLIDQGMVADEIVRRLMDDYLVAEDRARLITDVGFHERPFLCTPEEARSLTSVYVGVPYCPSRCHYCSFPASALRHPEEQLPRFLQALRREMAGMGAAMREMGLSVNTIYLGGGTPSVLGSRGIARVFQYMASFLPLGQVGEVTVEAGRPDTLSRELLDTIKEAGATRLCVNPQTMNDHTLAAIGRCHTSAQVVRAVEMAREAGIKTINMDIIIGLPGEGRQEWEKTAREILKIRPENVTVHTLAAKKGSILVEREGLGEWDKGVGQGVEIIREVLASHGYIPYYLYRQKNMLDHLENIGYCLPGHECRYNIQIIEERQTIIGLGGGAGSKFVRPWDWTLTSHYNPRNPEVYVQSIGRLVAAKVDKLRSLALESS